MNRLTLRARLGAVFVAAMALVLAVIGIAVYLETKKNIDASIRQALRVRQSALRDFASHPPRGTASLIPPAERYAQLQRADGSVIESRPAAEPPMLSPPQLRAALERPHVFELHEQTRYFAGPARIRGQRVIAVTATSLAQHEHALESLAAGLLIGGPSILICAALIAYVVMARALRPIDAMRERASSITHAHVDARLPVPPVDDEVRRLALTLNDMLDRLATTAAAERRLIANASHELRTPLAALRADLEVALRPGAERQELLETITRVRGDAVRLTALSQSLLDLSRQEEQETTEWELVPVAELIDLTLATLDQHPERGGRQVTAHPTQAVVAGRRDDLLRAMVNLAENALLHGRGRVSVSAHEGTHGTMIRVEDEGELDAATAKVAFERFARGPEATNRPGAGLGLSLVQTIARQHGGEATLENVDGGVRAEIWLPTPDARPDRA